MFFGVAESIIKKHTCSFTAGLQTAVLGRVSEKPSPVFSLVLSTMPQIFSPFFFFLFPGYVLPVVG